MISYFPISGPVAPWDEQEAGCVCNGYFRPVTCAGDDSILSHFSGPGAPWDEDEEAACADATSGLSLVEVIFWNVENRIKRGGGFQLSRASLLQPLWPSMSFKILHLAL
jgi:hypothetical protein